MHPKSPGRSNTNTTIRRMKTMKISRNQNIYLQGVISCNHKDIFTPEGPEDNFYLLRTLKKRGTQTPMRA